MFSDRKQHSYRKLKKKSHLPTWPEFGSISAIFTNTSGSPSYHQILFNNYKIQCQAIISNRYPADTEYMQSLSY